LQPFIPTRLKLPVNPKGRKNRISISLTKL
jgi:hypothetical protein